MKEFTYTIQDPMGIHARPAGLLTKEASKYASTITVNCGSKKGDAKKIMSLMMMAVKQGQTVTVSVDGTDEEAAAAAMEEFIKANF